jgi:signal peptidase I
MVALVGAVAAWLALAPAQVGGAVTYVIVAGASMEPHIHAGDLVLVRSAPLYHVGDVVAYQNREMGRVVLHRIIDLQGGRYVLKGDANSWVDSYHPTREDIIGRMWARVPRLGRALEWLRKPEHAAVAAGGLTGALGAVGIGEARRRRRAQGGPPVMPLTVGGWLLAILAAVTAAFGGLAAVAFTRDETRLVQESIPVRHVGRFSYQAAVPSGVVYDGPQAVTGEPIFLSLAQRVQAGFAYRLDASVPHQAEGRARLLAVVGDPSPGGWRRTLELAPWQEFQGDEATVSGVLDLGQVRELLAQVEKATGLNLTSYRLSLVPQVEVRVQAAGSQTEQTFSPPLHFRLDRVQLAMEGPSSPLGREEDPTRPVQEGALLVSREEEATMSGLGVRAPVRAVRLASVVGGGVSLLGLGATAGLMAFGLVGGEERRIRALYGHLILPAAAVQVPPGPLVWVKDMDALARLAHARATFVLHDEGQDRYLVLGEGVTYAYRPAGPPPQETAPAEGGRPSQVQELSALREEIGALRQELMALAQDLTGLRPEEERHTPGGPQRGQQPQRPRSLWERMWGG